MDAKRDDEHCSARHSEQEFYENANPESFQGGERRIEGVVELALAAQLHEEEAENEPDEEARAGDEKQAEDRAADRDEDRPRGHFALFELPPCEHVAARHTRDRKHRDQRERNPARPATDPYGPYEHSDKDEERPGKHGQHDARDTYREGERGDDGHDDVHGHGVLLSAWRARGSWDAAGGGFSL